MNDEKDGIEEEYIDEEDVLNTESEDSKEEVSEARYTGSFGLFPFVFTGMYYIWHRKYLFGIFLVILCSIIPLKGYFIVGLVVALFCGKVRGGVATFGSAALSILLGILFVVLRVLRLVFTGGV